MSSGKLQKRKEEQKVKLVSLWPDHKEITDEGKSLIFEEGGE